MWNMAKNSMILFARGKLFKNVWAVLGNSVLGILITAVLFIGLLFAGLQLWLTVGISSAIGGFIMPFLFKDLKYA